MDVCRGHQLQAVQAGCSIFEQRLGWGCVQVQRWRKLRRSNLAQQLLQQIGRPYCYFVCSLICASLEDYGV
jgi:hypothetical protein